VRPDLGIEQAHSVRGRCLSPSDRTSLEPSVRSAAKPATGRRCTAAVISSTSSPPSLPVVDHVQADNAGEAALRPWCLPAQPGEQLRPDTHLAARRAERDRQEQRDELLDDHQGVEPPHQISERVPPCGPTRRLADRPGDHDRGHGGDDRADLPAPSCLRPRDGVGERPHQDEVHDEHHHVEEPRARLAEDVGVAELGRAAWAHDRQKGKSEHAGQNESSQPSERTRAMGRHRTDHPTRSSVEVRRAQFAY
jgi:hypothetical protein